MLLSPVEETVSPAMMGRAVVNGVIVDLDRSNGRRVDPLTALSLVRLLGMHAAGRFEDHRNLGILEPDNFRDLNAVRGESYSSLKSSVEEVNEVFGGTRAEFAAHFSALLEPFTVDEETDVELGEEKLKELRSFLSLLSKSLSEALPSA
jgi:hypothetical protein